MAEFTAITNETDALKIAFGQYLGRWYGSIVPSTLAMQSFIQRGFGVSVQYTAGRMIDDVMAMLESYRKNENTDVNNASSKLPVVLVALAKDYTPTMGDWGGRQYPEEMLQLDEGDDQPIYKFSMSMYDVRIQVVFIAAEDATARALARSFSWYVSQIPNRRFYQTYTFGEHELAAPVVIESPDIILQNQPTEQKNMTILSCDLTLKVTVPQLKAPDQDGDDVDGSCNNPMGYKKVDEILVTAEETLLDTNVNEDGQETGDKGTL